MARLRSPSYPSIPLEEALDLVQKIHSRNRTNAISREAAARDMGYSGLTGRSLKVLAALIQYGLLEPAGKAQTRVTQRAVTIVHGLIPERKKAALKEAGEHPKLFKELATAFEDGPPSENAIRSYLIQRDFADVAIGPAVKAFVETYAYLEKAGVYESHGEGGENEEESSLPPPPEDEPRKGYGGARVGDLIDYESHGVIANPAPMRVRALSDNQAWVFVEGSETGLKMKNVIVRERAAEKPPVLPVDQSTADTAPQAGYRSETFDTDEGAIKISWPNNLSPQSVEDMKDWLELLKRRIARRAGADD